MSVIDRERTELENLSEEIADKIHRGESIGTTLILSILQKLAAKYIDDGDPVRASIALREAEKLCENMSGEDKPPELYRIPSLLEGIIKLDGADMDTFAAEESSLLASKGWTSSENGYLMAKKWGRLTVGLRVYKKDGVRFFNFNLIFSYAELPNLTLEFNGDGEYPANIYGSGSFRDLAELDETLHTVQRRMAYELKGMAVEIQKIILS